MGLERYPHLGTTAPQVGDILVVNEGPFGHLAIVRSVTNDSICTIQQNFANDSTDTNLCRPLVISNGAYRILSKTYPVRGWLRKSGSAPPNCSAGSSENYPVDGRPPVHPNGTLIKKRNDQTYYALIDGQKRGIPSPDVLHNLYGGENSEFEFNDVVTVSDAEFNSYPTGPPVNSPLPSNGLSQPNGRLIKAPGKSEVSIVSDGKRRPFTDANIFLNLGYVFCNVIEVSDYDSYPVGPSINGSTPGCGSLTPTLIYQTDLLADGYTAGGWGVRDIDSQGNLILVSGYSLRGASCPTGCPLRVHSVSPTGKLNWQTEYIGSSGHHSNMILGPNDRIYLVNGWTSVIAVDSSGKIVPGWPVGIPDVTVRDGNPVVDSQDGTVYMKGSVTFSFSGFPAVVIAVNPDGTQKWRKDYPDGASAAGIVQGQGRNIFTNIGRIGLVGLDHNNGSQVCQAATGFSPQLAGPDGTLFGVTNVTSTDSAILASFPACDGPRAIFSNPGRFTTLLRYDQDVLFGSDSPAISGGDPPSYFAVSKEGKLLWRNSEIAAAAGGPSIQVIKDGILYILGQHTSDGNKSKLFLVNAQSGKILSSIETSSICTGCGVVVARDGTIFISDSAGKIYKTRSCSADSTPPTVSAFNVTPRSQTTGNPFTISYTVSDSGGSGLNRVELWRTVDKSGSPDQSAWKRLKDNLHLGDGPFSGSFSDAPGVGAYWYGIHVFDNAGEQANESAPIKVTVVAPDNTPPTVITFNVTPRSQTAGNPFTISYTVSDSGGSELNRVELWRTVDDNGQPNSSKWAEVKRDSLSGNGPVSSSFSDAPAVGIYWYGIHALDNANNQRNEPAPIKVTVTAFPLITWISHGYQDFREPDLPPEWTRTMTQTITEKTGQLSFPFSWVRQSNNAGEGWAEAAGEQLASRIMAYDPNKQHNHHLIGHSLGSVVVSEATRRLLAQGYRVVQVTYLDPVDGIVDFAVTQYRKNPLVRSWSGVIRVDSYWGNGMVVDRNDVPQPVTLKGHAVAGAINTYIVEGQYSSHEGVHNYYQKTIEDTAFNEAPTSYRNLDDSVISSSALCLPINTIHCRGGWYWSPNGGGWAREAPGEDKQARVPVTEAPLLFNGDFEQPEEKSGNGRTWAGYEWHMQSGDFTRMFGHKNALLEKLPNSNNYAAFLGVVAGPAHLEHAPFFLPRGTALLRYDYWVERVGFRGNFKLKINNQEIPLGKLERTSGFQPREVDISAYAGQLVSIRFEGAGVGVWLDNLRIAQQSGQVHTLTINPTPQNGKITGQGINCGAGGNNDCTESFANRASVELAAAPANGYRLEKWSGCTSSNGDRCTVLMTQARTVSATFAQACTLPKIIAQPLNYQTAIGGIVSFIAAASGDPAPTVQWQAAPNGSNVFSNISGATSLAMNFTANAADNGKKYRAVFTNACGPMVSNAATLTLVTSPLLVSEFRLYGPSGGGDWFVELYNNTDAPLSSNGRQLGFVDANGAAAFGVSLTANKTIPPRGYYLVAGPDYSLTGLAAPDQVAPALPLNGLAGVGVFNGPINNAANRLDSAAFSSVASNAAFGYFREGAGLPPIGNAVTEHSFMRKQTNGAPQDTDNNLNDFVLLSPAGGVINGVQAVLGAPGPQSSTSPMERNATMPSLMMNPNVSASSPPNRERNTTPAPNGALGTLTIRRKFTNNTGAPIKKLRFRVIDITNKSSGSEAELRALSSVDVMINGQPVRGTALEQPPAQPNGGGMNSTLAVGVITLSNPLPSGASVNVQFLLGVQRGGSFRFFVNVEALN